MPPTAVSIFASNPTMQREQSLVRKRKQKTDKIKQLFSYFFIFLYLYSFYFTD